MADIVPESVISPTVEILQTKAGFATKTGLEHPENQDSYGMNQNLGLYFIGDGMGHGGPDALNAALAARNEILRYFEAHLPATKDDFKDNANVAWQNARNKIVKDYPHSGDTTASLVQVVKESGKRKARVAWSGDSLALALKKDGSLTRLNTPQNTTSFFDPLRHSHVIDFVNHALDTISTSEELDQADRDFVKIVDRLNPSDRGMLMEILYSLEDYPGNEPSFYYLWYHRNLTHGIKDIDEPNVIEKELDKDVVAVITATDGLTDILDFKSMSSLAKKEGLGKPGFAARLAGSLANAAEERYQAGNSVRNKIPDDITLYVIELTDK